MRDTVTDRVDLDAYAQVQCVGIDPTIGLTGCGTVPLTYEQYVSQMNRPDATWRCPNCRGDAIFDDAHFEATHYAEDAGEEGAF